MSDLFWLTPSQLGRNRPYFPLAHGIPRVDDRRVVSGIIYVLKLRLHPLHAGRRGEGEMDTVSVPARKVLAKYTRQLIQQELKHNPAGGPCSLCPNGHCVILRSTAHCC